MPLKDYFRSANCFKSFCHKRSGSFDFTQSEYPDSSYCDEMKTRLRTLVAFWIFGFCSLYTYQIVLSAAHDLLTHKGNVSAAVENLNGTIAKPHFQCNALSTGAILLADNIPGLALKLIISYFSLPPTIGICSISLIFILALLVVGLTHQVWLTFLGVCIASLATGLSEVIFLRFSTMQYSRKELISWASGTGATAAISATAYAGLTTAGLSSRTTLLTTLFVPVLIIFTYCFVLIHPKKRSHKNTPNIQDLKEDQANNHKNYNSISTVCAGSESRKYKQEPRILKQLKMMKSLMRFMLPLIVVYMAENFINLGLYELIYISDSALTQNEQYRWFITAYQIGIFVARSFGSILNCRFIWVFPALQVLNVVIFILEAIYDFIPAIWIILLLNFYEGTLGGAAYVNIFSIMMEEVKDDDKEFSMSFVSIGDTLGIVLAGAIALPVHDYICNTLK